MNWFSKIASDEERISNNIERLEELRKTVHDLAYFGIASQSGGFKALQGLVENQLIRGRPKVHEKLTSALIGENNQKLVLDAPMTFQRVLFEAEDLINREIKKEKVVLRELAKSDGRKSETFN